MTPFEEQLKQAMARHEPPPDFTARVLSRAAEQGRHADANGGWGWLHGMLRGMQIRRLITVAAVFLVISGGTIYEQHRRAARGEAAKESLVMGMRIAGSKLHKAQHRVFDVEYTEVAQ